jgi:predicted small secreted protein
MAPAGRPRPGVRTPDEHRHDAPEASMKRLVPMLLLALFSIASLGACNTVAGVGEDIQSAGDTIEDEAEGHIDCDESDDC